MQLDRIEPDSLCAVRRIGEFRDEYLDLGAGERARYQLAFAHRDCGRGDRLPAAVLRAERFSRLPRRGGRGFPAGVGKLDTEFCLPVGATERNDAAQRRFVRV